MQLNKERIKGGTQVVPRDNNVECHLKGKTSKMLEAALEEKRREIIKEWIKEGKIKKLKTKWK